MHGLTMNPVRVNSSGLIRTGFDEHLILHNMKEDLQEVQGLTILNPVRVMHQLQRDLVRLGAWLLISLSSSEFRAQTWESAV